MLLFLFYAIIDPQLTVKYKGLTVIVYKDTAVFG